MKVSIQRTVLIDRLKKKRSEAEKASVADHPTYASQKAEEWRDRVRRVVAKKDFTPGDVREVHEPNLYSEREAKRYVAMALEPYDRAITRLELSEQESLLVADNDDIMRLL